MARLILLVVLSCIVLAGCGEQAAQPSDSSEKKPTPVTVPADKQPGVEKVPAEKKDSAKDSESTPREQGEIVAENGPDPSMPETITAADVDPLSDDETMALSDCQTMQVYSALGQSEADAYFEDLTDRIVEDFENEEGTDMTLQTYMWNDGYRCPGFIE